MPAHIYLNIFGSLIIDAFDEVPYQVGSSLDSKDWRDVDVRLILPPEKWVRFIGEDYQEGNSFPNGSRRAALEMAFDALGEHITGLPIDFQIQTVEVGNRYEGNRSAIGLRVGASGRHKETP